MRLRLFSALLALVLPAVASAQEPEYEESYPADTTWSDTTYLMVDTTADDDDFYRGDFEPPAGGPQSMIPGAGLYGGPIFEVTDLDPAALDPALSGDLVLYGGRVYLIINGWMIGGEWVGATLYDLSPQYEQFEFSYGGFLTGYDLDIYDGLSIRADLLIGGGDLNMVKKRPDLAASDSTGHVILERYRQEGFFTLKPGASLGYAPLPFLDLRFSVSYLYPIGGDRVADLKSLVYGLHVMLGIGR